MKVVLFCILLSVVTSATIFYFSQTGPFFPDISQHQAGCPKTSKAEF